MYYMNVATNNSETDMLTKRKLKKVGNLDFWTKVSINISDEQGLLDCKFTLY